VASFREQTKILLKQLTILSSHINKLDFFADSQDLDKGDPND